MRCLAVQYLDSVPNVASIPAPEIGQRLRHTFERLPLSYVLLGWNLPDSHVQVCADECARANAQLYRWQPLLSGDGVFTPRPEWHTIGLDGKPVGGFQEIAEFTFMCPNRPAAQEAVQAYIQSLLADNRYHGLFLDRIRFPSPTLDPAADLGCFCEDCHAAAAAEGLDLETVRQAILRLVNDEEDRYQLVKVLLDPAYHAADSVDLDLLHRFLRFRCRSVTRFVGAVCQQIRAEGRSVGLDCFSPAVAHMVGQSLGDLNSHADWIKIMSYGHAFGPAILPFELFGLADWLVSTGMTEARAMLCLSAATHLPLPQTRRELRQTGLPPQALKSEVVRGRELGIGTLLAGIELVEMPGISELNPPQIAADLTAFREGGADGLVLSWDMWSIPLERLEIVRQVWA